jgi:uridine kinase
VGTTLRHPWSVNRVAIAGPVASGKTTLAARLGSSLGLPVFDLDDYCRLRGNPAPLLTSWRWIWRYANHGRLETERALTHSRLTPAIFRLRSGNEVDKLLRQIDGFRS